MDRLPNELLEHITGQCGHRTLIRLRCVNKTFSELLAPAVFEHIYTGWTKKHLNHLKSIASSPLAQYVQRLTINTEVLPLLSEDDWAKYLYISEKNLGKQAFPWHSEPKEGEAFDLLLRSYEQDELDSNYRNFREIALQQQVCSPDLGEELAAALERLPHVQSLGLVDRKGDHEPKRGRIWSCSPWKQSLLDGREYFVLQDARFYNPPEGYGKEKPTSAWVLYNIAASLTRHRDNHNNGLSSLPIRDLVLHTGHQIPVARIFELTNCQPPPLPKPLINDVFGLFATLTKISIIEMEVVWPAKHREEVCGEIALCLTKAINLQHLEIHANHIDSEHVFHALCTPWPRLEHLRLSGYMAPYSILPLLRLHAKTLLELELFDLDLGTSCEADPRAPHRWFSFFEEVRATLKLERATLARLYDWDTGLGKVLYFAAQASAKTEIHLAVEEFLMAKVDTDTLPPPSEWDWIRCERMTYRGRRSDESSSESEESTDSSYKEA